MNEPRPISSLRRVTRASLVLAFVLLIFTLYEHTRVRVARGPGIKGVFFVTGPVQLGFYREVWSGHYFAQLALVRRS